MQYSMRSAIKVESTMDTRERFRNFVTNVFMPDFDYLNTNFSFETVFYRTGFSYCMCGFHREYLDLERTGTSMRRYMMKLYNVW